MLTLPTITSWGEQPYVALKEQVTIPFGDAVGRAFDEVFGWLSGHGIAPAGAPFIKYNRIAMPQLELEFGVPVAASPPADGRIVSGTLPAGAYATLTYWGSFDNLMEANTVLVGWAMQKGLKWDSETSPAGEHFAARLEIYETDPQKEPDQSKWETIVAIKLADG